MSDEKDEIPRAANMLRWTEAEHAIHSAMMAVEAAGSDPMLTGALTDLSSAKTKVAAWVDRAEPVDAGGCAPAVMASPVEEEETALPETAGIDPMMPVADIARAGGA
jgi:hypothetical protein